MFNLGGSNPRDTGRKNNPIPLQESVAVTNVLELSGLSPRDHVNLKVRIHGMLLEMLDTNDMGNYDPGLNDGQLRNVLRKAIMDIMAVENIKADSTEDENGFIQGILDEMLGLSQLEGYLRDPTITEIMVNGPHQVFIERSGKLIETDTVFLNDSQLMRVIERIVSPLGRRIDESSPMVDARLHDGSRVNAIIPPLSLNGPILTIRKFSKTPLTGHDLVRMGSMTDEVLDFLEECVKDKLNILVSGGTGSGKTTLLNLLSSFIGSDDRVITIEDAAELKLAKGHVISLEARPANSEGRGSISIRELVKNALRMRPDRIIIGEVRGAEALDMLQAMNTGHSGSLTTCHANSTKDALSRLETMVLMAGMELPLKAVRNQIASAMDIILQQARMPDGSRRIVRITQVLGTMDDEFNLNDLYALSGTMTNPVLRKVGSIIRNDRELPIN